MTADGPATHWARTVRPSGGVVDGSELDRHAVSAHPGYRDTVAAAVSAAVAEVRAARAARLAELRRDDPSAAAELGRSTGRTFALLAAVLAACGAASLYFSRAQFDPEAILPVAAGLIVVGAVLAALALLPLRRAAPPTTGAMAVAWFMFVLSAGSMTMAGMLDGASEPTVVAFAIGLAGTAGLATLAISVTILVVTTPPERRARTRERVAAFPDEVARGAAESVRDAVERLRVAWAAAEPEVRRPIEADVAGARRVLEERRLDVDGLAVVPGEQVLLRTATASLPALRRELDRA